MSAKLRLIICNEQLEQIKESSAVTLTVPPLPEAVEEPEEPEEPQAETDITPKAGNKMFPALVGLVLAMVFGLMAHTVYGTMGLTDEAWVNAVFWTIIATGVAVSLLQFQSDSVP